MVVTAPDAAPPVESREALTSRWATSSASGRPLLLAAPGAPGVTVPWLRAQALNADRHAAALRPFRREEFGSGAAAPSEGHIGAANGLIQTLLNDLLRVTPRVATAVEIAMREPGQRIWTPPFRLIRREVSE